MSRNPVRQRSVLAQVTVVLAALVLSGCGFSAQTLQPYTPADGVNLDVGGIKIRNVLVVADESGNGVLSGSMVSDSTDELASLQVVPISTADEPLAPLTVSAQRPVKLNPGVLVVLTDPTPAIAVSGETLVPGETVTLSFAFASGKIGEIVSPVMSTSDISYESLASAIPTPESSPTPTP